MTEALDESSTSYENSFRSSSTLAARWAWEMLLLASAMGGQEEPGNLLTLEEAVSLARSHNRELKQAGLEIHKQKEAFSEAKTQVYPRFDLYLLASELLNPLDFTILPGTFGNFPATGPIPAKNAQIHTPARPVAITSVTATQPLTQLFRIDLSIKEQKLGVELSQQSYSEGEQARVSEVRHRVLRDLAITERARIATRSPGLPGRVAGAHGATPATGRGTES
jgi:outer membrane protein TolC